MILYMTYSIYKSQNETKILLSERKLQHCSNETPESRHSKDFLALGWYFVQYSDHGNLSLQYSLIANTSH